MPMHSWACLDSQVMHCWSGSSKLVPSQAQHVSHMPYEAG